MGEDPSVWRSGREVDSSGLGTALAVRKEDCSYVSPDSGDKFQVLAWTAWGTVIEVQRKKRLKEGGEKGPGPLPACEGTLRP